MTRHESLFGEIIYDLSYLGGEDDLLRFVEDSRNLCQLLLPKGRSLCKG